MGKSGHKSKREFKNKNNKLKTGKSRTNVVQFVTVHHASSGAYVLCMWCCLQRKGTRQPKSSEELKGQSQQERFTFFWRQGSPFSQWHAAHFVVDDVKFVCAEQYMMYKKAELFHDQDAMQQILDSTSPKFHKAIGRLVQGFKEGVWKRNRTQIVYEASMAKFSQNASLRHALVRTAGTTLVEASPSDCIWGIGLRQSDPRAAKRHKWRGLNLLGETLTRVRDELITQEQEGVYSDSLHSSSSDTDE